jgi:hypothetical protein
MNAGRGWFPAWDKIWVSVTRERGNISDEIHVHMHASQRAELGIRVAKEARLQKSVARYRMNKKMGHRLGLTCMS